MESARPLAPDIAAVRRFSRSYTQRVGVLHRRLLGTAFSITEARVLLEIATHDAPRASDIASRLGVDPAYLSRVLQRFAREGLVERSTDNTDRRGFTLQLTPSGAATFRDLDARADADIAAILRPLNDAERDRLVTALGVAAALLGERAEAQPATVLREPRAGDLGWIIHRHGVLYREEYGWDQSFEHIVIGIIAGYLDTAEAGRDRCWVADNAGEVVGSVFLEHCDETTAKLRLLYVEPAMRGRGLGGRLVDECIKAARRGGYRVLTLWTMSALHDARRLYESRGFRLAASQRVRQFGQDLSSLTYDLDLTGPPPPA